MHLFRQKNWQNIYLEYERVCQPVLRPLVVGDGVPPQQGGVVPCAHALGPVHDGASQAGGALALLKHVLLVFGSWENIGFRNYRIWELILAKQIIFFAKKKNRNLTLFGLYKEETFSKL